MKGLAFLFFVTAVIYGIAGMAFGIHMSAVGDHSLSPAHGHLNLIGWVGMALFGFYYHLVPASAATLMARAHFVLASVGVWLVVPGIVMAINEQGEFLAKTGSAVTLLSMVLFLLVVIRGRRAATP